MAGSLRRSLMLFPLAFALTGTPIAAQVSSDGTLPTPTTVTQAGADFMITGGTRPGGGANLFHSFNQFSVPTGGAAIFNNATDVQTIFSRVTGGNVSSIDGAIRANGSANLFLLNPSGILFGPNASLNIGGSFVGTTASSIKFANGAEFVSTATPLPTPLLTVTVPVGLQMGNAPGAIQINGTGHSLVSPSPTVTPYLSVGAIAGLKVQPGNTLALVGGDINLVGGALTAEGGRVELGSVGQRQIVGLDASAPALKLDFATVNQFSNISLSQRSLVDVSGVGASSIQVQGQQVRLTDGSLLFVQNRGPQTAGDISIRTDALEVMGGIAPINVRSALLNETLAGNSGNISISTRTLELIDGGSIFTRSFGAGASGNIHINASTSVKVAGYLATNLDLFSGIGTIGFSPLPSGRSGTIEILTPTLSLREGGIVTAATFGNAAAGNINVNANLIEVVGTRPKLFGQSALSSSTFGQGNAGNIVLNTDVLAIQTGATVNTVSSTSGAAGNITINARRAIEIADVALGLSSDISSSVNIPDAATQALLGISGLPQGNAGNIALTTPALVIKDQGRLRVLNDGLGNGGRLTVTADHIVLDSQGSITATTASGEGGNIALQAQTLIMRRNSSVTATAGESGSGGNITINSSIVAGFENSDIIANAIQGRGGTIQITTQGIFGLQFRPQLTPENDITASSQFGVTGTVQVNTIGVDPSAGLVELPVNLTDTSRQIVAGCAGTQDNQFVITGRGGIPEDPSQGVRRDRPWADLRDPTAHPSPTPPLPTSPTPKPLLEATTWQRTRSGEIELVTDRLAQTPQPATCARAGIN